MNAKTRPGHLAVTVAKAFGVLGKPGACEICGRHMSRMVWHHWSYEYDDLLDVIPLCTSCHVSIHNGGVREPRTGAVYGPWNRSRVDAAIDSMRHDCPTCSATIGEPCTGPRVVLKGRFHATRLSLVLSEDEAKMIYIDKHGIVNMFSVYINDACMLAPQQQPQQNAAKEE